MKKEIIVIKFLLIFIIVFAVAFLIYNSIEESDKWLNIEFFENLYKG